VKHLFLPVTAVALVIFMSGIFFWYRGSLRAVNQTSQKSPTRFVITKNQSANSILVDLKQAGFIRSVVAVKIYLKLNHLENKLQPGGYSLSNASSAAQIIDSFIHGPEDLWVTIPEGWRREQIAVRLDSILSGSGSVFDPMEFIRLTATIEGQLFPDTYLVPPQATAFEIIKMMTGNFAKKSGLEGLKQKNLSGMAYTPEDILIIASLVEREAKSDADRATIAGILMKRYSAGWPLQVDASAQYAVDSYNCRNSQLTCNWWQSLPDTGFKSAYNTYLNPGLPPAPLCNPGQAAISAAADLKNTATPYWFYLHDTRGIAHFAINMSQHQLNIDKYLHP
jgi:UPF0755 protein